MITVMLIMVAGIVVGYFLRKRRLSYVPHTITILIWLLLFFLGASIGSNDKIMDSLGTLGLEAAGLSVLTLLGSMGAAWLLWRLCKKEGK